MRCGRLSGGKSIPPVSCRLNPERNCRTLPAMLPALFLIPLVALFRIFLAWQPVGASTWLMGASPLAAVALCGGLFLPRRLALAVPLGILLLSDLVIDAHYGANFFDASLLARYVLLALIGLGGMALRHASARGVGVFALLAATLAGSVFFYVASNTLTWLGSPAYAQTAAGLWQALTVGLPGFPPSYLFFRNALVSDGLYSMVFLACVRLTRPVREANHSPFQAAAGSDRLLSGAPHRG